MTRSAGILILMAALLPGGPSRAQAPLDPERVGVGLQFEVLLSGSTESGPFEDIPAELMILPAVAGGYELSLFSSGEIRNGWFQWSSAAIRATSAGAEVNQVEARRDGAASIVDLSWWTGVTGTAGQPLHVAAVATKAELKLTFLDERTVAGEIAGEGVSMQDSQAASRYRATFHGQIKTSKAVEEIRHSLDGNRPVPEIATFHDANAAKNLGVDLSLEGKCKQAVVPLEAALSYYQRDFAAAASGLERDMAMSYLYGTVVHLARCDLDLGDYDRFLVHLDAALSAFRAGQPDESSWQAFKDQSKTFQERLTLTSDLLGSLAEIFGRLRQEAGSPPPGSRASAPAGTIRVFEAEIGSLRRDLSEHLATVQRLVSEGPEKGTEKGPAPEAAFSTPRRWRAELGQRVRAALERLGAASQPILEREPRLVAIHDRIWQHLRGNPRDIEMTAVLAADKELIEALKGADGLTDLEKELVFQQFKTEGVLELLHGSLRLDDEMQSQQEEALTALAQSMVEAAAGLAKAPERWRADVATDREKRDVLERLQPFFSKAVSLLLGAGRQDEALVVSEIARSRALVDLLAGRAEVRRKLEKAGDLRSLPSPVAAPPLSLAEIRETVRRRQGVTIEYFLSDPGAGDPRLSIWVIPEQGRIEAVSLPLDREDLQRTVTDLGILLEKTSSADGDASRIGSLLSKLHDLLIGAIPAGLLPVSPEQVVTLIPHEELFQVPFAALQDAQGRSLIEKHPLVYGISIAALKHTAAGREKLPPRKPRLLALVNPAPMPRRKDGTAFAPLRLLEHDFSRISGFYPKADQLVLKGKAATEAALLEHAPEYSTLYLVTHGYLDPDPLASYVALAGGSLEVPEVFRLDLQADLVILWACQTGLGRPSADGVMGLSRAFTWAGASALMSSLWSITEQETFFQMYAFHHFWRKEGRSKAQALRLAQLEASRRHSEQPWLWSGLVLYGDGG